MARKGQVKPHEIAPDPVYNDIFVSKFINRVMKSGKKSVAQKQVYAALAKIKQETKKEPVELFHQALENIKPAMEVRSRRIGGAAYQVPTPVRGKRKESLAIRWLIEGAQARSNSEFRTFGDKLAAEIMEAVKGEGVAVKKKTDMERLAESNRAFSHFKW
jgi:small subunit ribosomal protein S7